MPPEYQQQLIDRARPLVERDLLSTGREIRALAELNKRLLDEAQQRVNAARTGG